LLLPLLLSAQGPLKKESETGISNSEHTPKSLFR
jgi:hypothetical protein